MAWALPLDKCARLLHLACQTTPLHTRCLVYHSIAAVPAGGVEDWPEGGKSIEIMLRKDCTLLQFEWRHDVRGSDEGEEDDNELLEEKSAIKGVLRFEGRKDGDGR